MPARTGKHAAGCVNKFCSMVDERTVTESSSRRSGPATAFALFDTTLGVCGIAWNDGGVVGVHLPARDAAATRMRLEQKFRDARESQPSTEVARTIERIVALLCGERVDLSTVPLDMTGIDKFDRDVYVAARDVGVALARNPFAIVVPCHRVVAANGKTGGFSAGGGVATKLKLLAIEGGMGPLFD